VLFPVIVVQASDLTIRESALFVRGSAVESAVNTIPIVILFVQQQFPVKITSSPERYLIEILSSYCADQSLDERMRQGHVRHGFDLHHFGYSKVGVPPVESE
jgi:hypothetical protein